MDNVIWRDVGRKSAGCLTLSGHKSAGNWQDVCCYLAGCRQEIGRISDAIWQDVCRYLALTGGRRGITGKTPIVVVFSWLAECAGAPANPRF